MHRQWEMNGYRGAKGQFTLLNLDKSNSLRSADMHSAYVRYSRRGMLGVEWFQRYQIERSSTNDPVWTLYEIRSMEHPRLPFLNRTRRMITVTNSL